ncbi:hypothetical protein [Herbidospora cretacea]|uniref:hypothetical protein n=1 Tax=Herbidospora cretacea TaxID=28444 RepID=UPI00077306C1|nr:hypothetical protein [Herbidospora cretacea]
MQDPSDTTELAESEKNGQSDATGLPVSHGPTSDSDIDSSTVLAEVLPGIAVLFGDVPVELKPGLIDFGLVPVADREQISALLASIGNAATVVGHFGTAIAGAQGIYKLSDTTMALLKAGGTLAVKDGANLGAVMASGRIVGQARLIPIASMSAVQTLSAIGPALAMVALQMQLNEITGLVRTNIALTTQVLTDIRHGQWAELTALVATVDDVVDQAGAVESVPTSLWDTVAGKKADLRKQIDLYRLNVGGHIRQIHGLGSRGRREYLETNAEAIVFDSNALLLSIKAWIGYQALHAARARAAGTEDAGEARLVEDIARRTGKELESIRAETASLVDSLTRELRIIVELPGRATLPLPGKRKDANSARQTSALVLAAIEPLADALNPPAPPLEAPDVVCASDSLALEPYLRILQWFLEDGETLRVLGFPDEPDAPDTISAIFGGVKGIWATAAKTLVAVTDRRIITGQTNAFLEQGEISQVIPIDRVRYVRVATSPDSSTRAAIDLITRDENIQWLFSTDIDSARIDAFAAVLAESMAIPDVERHELLRRGHALTDAGNGEDSSDAAEIVATA